MILMTLYLEDIIETEKKNTFTKELKLPFFEEKSKRGEVGGQISVEVIAKFLSHFEHFAKHYSS
jgi:hypothetical protein